MGLNKLIFLIVIIGTIIVSSCRSKSSEKLELGYNLYPDEVGRELIYQVDSIRIDRFVSKTLEFHFQIKEVIESKFIDNAGKTVNRVIIYQRTNDSFPWQVRAVVSTYKDSMEMFRTEDNQRYMKLVFPVILNKKWDINLYNTLETDIATYSKVYEPASVGKYTFDSTVSIIIQDDTNQIERRYRSEIWSKGIGMVYKQTDTVDYQPNQYPFGILYRMTLIDFKP